METASFLTHTSTRARYGHPAESEGFKQDLETKEKDSAPWRCHEQNDDMLIAENLSCIRGERVLFENLGFCLGEGGLLIIKGTNGAGKTSLLHILCGLLTPSAGHVETENVRGIYVGAKNALKERLTVYENLEFYSKLHDGSPLLVDSALKFFDIEDRAEQTVATLSSGLKRRVALARLLLGNYNLWILDEPTNFLDAEGVALLTSLIESRVQAGGIVVIASHTMGSAFASHMLQLEDFAPLSLRA